MSNSIIINKKITITIAQNILQRSLQAKRIGSSIVFMNKPLLSIPYRLYIYKQMLPLNKYVT